jgi:uncharacterized protein (TIGR02677 family)
VEDQLAAPADVTADAPAGPPTTGRPSLVARRLDGDELHRLVALRAATSEQTPLYGAVLAVLVEAKERYRLQLRTEEIAVALGGAGFDPSSLTGALDQLRQWDAVAWTQDATQLAATIEDYLKRHELWELTPVGEAVHHAITAVLDAVERSGALQRALFRSLRQDLEALAQAVADGDATAVYLGLRDLDSALVDLAGNARDFYAAMGRLRREDSVDDAVFLAYKDQLITYLQDFHDDLVRNRAVITGQLTRLDAERARLLALAAEGDDSGGLFAAGVDWSGRWAGMLAWFCATPGRPAGIDELGRATTAAIRDLITYLRRLTEAATRPVTRAAELTHLARWFARLESDDEAHELFDVAVGLGRPLHVGVDHPDPDVVAATASWWDAAAVPVPVTVRNHGRNATPGRTPRRVDYTAGGARLAVEQERRHGERAHAARRLRHLRLDRDQLSAEEWSLLLRLIDEALHARTVGAFECRVSVAETTVVLRSADADTEVHGPAGRLRLRGCELEVAA